MRYTFTAVFREDGGKVYARVPDLDGCITTGRDYADALEEMEDAMAAWLCTAEDEELVIPQPTPQGKIARDGNAVISLVSADTIKYRAQTDTRSVRKNVSLPAWLSNIADKRRINCSQVLQDALLARI